MSQSTQSLRESLSAAVDDEAQELELRRVLNAVQADAELGGKWERLHLIGGMIRGEAASRSDQSRRSGLDRPWLAEVALETTTADASQRWKRWLGPLTGSAAAMAAALAVVVYFGDSGEQPAPQALMPRGGLAEVPTQRDLLRANSYLLQHAQHASAAARPVALPFAKVLTTEDGRLAMPVSGPVGNDGR